MGKEDTTKKISERINLTRRVVKQMKIEKESNTITTKAKLQELAHTFQ
jgi:hypothetical protein